MAPAQMRKCGRRVAMEGDVVGDALLVETRGDGAARKPPGRRGRARSPPDRRPSGRPRCWSGSPDRRRRNRSTGSSPPSRRAPRNWHRRGRRAPLRPPSDFAQFERVEIVLDAEHRRRVDRLADEDAVDQLAALGHAEDLRQRPRRRVALQPRDRARRQDQHAVRRLAAERLLPGEGDDIELVEGAGPGRRRPRSRRRW